MFPQMKSAPFAGNETGPEARTSGFYSVKQFKVTLKPETVLGRFSLLGLMRMQNGAR